MGLQYLIKAGSHIIFGCIWWYSTVLQYPRTTIWKHSVQILNTVKYPQYRQIQGIANRTRSYSQYHEIPSATVGNHMGTHQIPLDTFGNPEYSNYLLFKRFLRWTQSSNKRWRPQTICSRASTVFIRTNLAKIQIYRQLLLATQIPNTQVFYGIWAANIKYWILSNAAKYYMGTSLNPKSKSWAIPRVWELWNWTLVCPIKAYC